MGDYRHSIVRTLEDFECYRGPWNELLERSSSSNNPFLTWEWLHSWVQSYAQHQRELFVLVAEENGEIVGVAPWYRREIKKGMLRIKQLEFLGTPAGSDYVDVLSKKGKEKEVANFIYDLLQTEAAPFWDRLVFREVPADSLFVLHFLEKIREKGKHVSIEESSFCPTVGLPGAEEEFFSRLSPKRERRFRQDVRTLGKRNKIEFFSSSSKDTVEKFFVFYSDKTGRSNEELHQLVNNYGMARGYESIQVDSLLSDGQPVASLLLLRMTNALSMYLMAVDKNYNPKVSIGNVMVGLSLGNAIRLGCSFYDFLRGSEDYKFHWTNRGRRSISVTFSQRKPSAVCLTLLDLMKSAGRTIFR